MSDFLKELFIDEVKNLGRGSGGVSSWNDLTDKPFDKEELLRVEWSGDLNNIDVSQCVVTDGLGVFLKVGEPLTAEQMTKLSNAEIKYKLLEGKVPYAYLRPMGEQEMSSSLSMWVLEGSYSTGDNFSLLFLNVKEDNVDIGAIFEGESMVVSDKGLYALLSDELPIELVTQNVKRIDRDCVPIKSTMQTILSTNNLAATTSNSNIIELERGFKYLIMLKPGSGSTTFTLRDSDDNLLIITDFSDAWQTVEIYHGDNFYIVNGEYCDFKTEAFNVTNKPKDISKLKITSPATVIQCRVIRVS